MAALPSRQPYPPPPCPNERQTTWVEGIAGLDLPSRHPDSGGSATKMRQMGQYAVALQPSCCPGSSGCHQAVANGTLCNRATGEWDNLPPRRPVRGNTRLPALASEEGRSSGVLGVGGRVYPWIGEGRGNGRKLNV